MEASLLAPYRDPAAAGTVSFEGPFSFWAVRGGVLAPRVPATYHWPAGLGGLSVVAPGLGARARCCRGEAAGSEGPSASCAVRFLSPRFLAGPHSPDPGVAAPQALCPSGAWPPGRGSAPPGFPRCVGRRVPKSGDPLRPRLGHAPLPRSKQRVCAPTAWARGHSPRRIGAPLGSPNPPPLAEARRPRLGLRWGWNRVGGAEWGRGRVPPPDPLFALLTRRWAGATRDRRGAPGRDDRGTLSSQRVRAALAQRQENPRGSRSCALGGSLPALFYRRGKRAP